jgi:primosomal protein N' (replication factor Y)
MNSARIILDDFFGIGMSLDLFVKVAVDVPGLAPLSYKVPNGEEPVVGMRCVVPVGRREMVGMIVEVSQHCEYDPSKVKL